MATATMAQATLAPVAKKYTPYFRNYYVIFLFLLLIYETNCDDAVLLD